MRHLLTKPKRYLAAAALVGTICTPALAADQAKPGTFVDQLAALNHIYGEIKFFMDKIIAEQPFFATNQPGLRNASLLLVQIINDNLRETKTVDSITDAIGPNTLPGVSNSQLRSLSMAQVPAGDSYFKGEAPVAWLGAPGGQAKICGNRNFSFESLISPDLYVKTKVEGCGEVDLKETATNFILNAANMGTPMLDFTPAQALADNRLETADQAEKLDQSEAYRKLKLARRHMLAVRSVGLSNLYYLYYQRMPAKGVTGETSEMQINDKNASNRVGNPEWYTKMLTAYPAQIEREQLFILAEMQQELHQMNITLQRSLATNSVSLLSAASGASLMLNMQMRDIDSAMNKIKEDEAANQTSGGGGATTGGGEGGDNNDEGSGEQEKSQAQQDQEELYRKAGVAPPDLNNQ